MLKRLKNAIRGRRPVFQRDSAQPPTQRVEMGDKVYQEFYCNRSGGGCGGYIRVKLHMGINHKVTVICPKCGHRHERYLVNGEIWDNQSYRGGAGRYEEELVPTMAAFSEEPYTKLFATSGGTRNSAVIRCEADIKEAV